MLLYAQLKPGPGFRPVRAILYYAQRLIVWPPLRRAIAGTLARIIHAQHGRIVPPDAAALAAVSTLAADGLVILPEALFAGWLQDLLAFLSEHPVIAGAREVAPAELRHRSGTAAYSLDAVLRAPHVLEIANHPAVLAIATRYLGCPPTISSIGIRWSLPGAEQQIDTQLFHRDCDDWRFVKLFVYLTDVAAGTGPHVYVRGSHRQRAGLRSRLLTKEEVARGNSDEAITTVLGAAGTCFIADTYGHHCGMPPVDGPRLILQVQYSILPIYAFLYRPVPLDPMPACDAYVNRLLFSASAANAAPEMAAKRS